jgi:hypothetical protein
MHFSLGIFSTSLQTWDCPSSYAHLDHKYGMHIWIILLNLLNWMVASIVAIVGSFLFFTLDISTLWLSCPQFVQCLPVFLISIYGFVIMTYLKICGTNNSLWAFTCVIPFSHNIATSLCNYNVVIIILVIAIFI